VERDRRPLQSHERAARPVVVDKARTWIGTVTRRSRDQRDTDVALYLPRRLTDRATISAVKFVVVALLGLAACKFDPQTAASSDGDPGVGDSGPNGGGASGDAKCPDSDGAGVCDAVDKCAGFDDAIDGDGDGVPDGCDTWKCGAAKPADPGNGGLPGRA